MLTIGLPLGHVETPSTDKPLPGGKFEQVDHSLIYQAHLYMLQNREEVQPFITFVNVLPLICSFIELFLKNLNNSLICICQIYSELNTN